MVTTGQQFQNLSPDERNKERQATVASVMKKPTLPTRKIGGRTVIFDPRRRGGTGLGAAAGSPTNIMEARTVQEISDIANTQQTETIEKINKVPVVGETTTPAPAPVEPPKTITAEDDVTEINRIADKKVADIQAETGRTMEDINQEVGNIRSQQKQEITAANYESDLEKKMRTAAKDDFAYEQFVDKRDAVRDISEKQGVDMNVAEGMYNNQVTAAAKLDPADKEIYGRILSRFDAPDFDPKEAYNVAIAEYEKDGFDGDDMKNALDAVASRYGQNFADEMSDEYLINVRKIAPEIVQGDRKLIDARKLGNTIVAGKGGARETNAYLRTLFDSGEQYVSEGLLDIINSPTATAAAIEQAFAFGKDFYSDVETGIGGTDDYLTDAKYKAGLGTPEKRAAFEQGTRAFNALKETSAAALSPDKRYFLPEEEGGYNKEERDNYLTQKGQLAAAGRKPIAGFSADVGAGTDYPNLDRADVLSAKKFIKDEFGTRYLSQNPDTLVEFLDEMESGQTLDDIGDNFRARQVSQATQNSEMYRQGFANVASGIIGSDNKKTFIDEADRRYQRGDIDGAKEFIKLNARNSGGIDQRNKIVGSEFTIKFLDDIEEDLREYEKQGGKTGIFSGTAEEIAGKVGEVLDSERREIATKIAAAIQTYRRSMSGVAFSVEESKEYAKMFPNIQSNLDLNVANLTALNEVMSLQLENFYSLAVGDIPYKAIFKNGGAAAETPKTPNRPEVTEEMFNTSLSEIETILGRPATDEEAYEYIYLDEKKNNPVNNEGKYGLRPDGTQKETGFLGEIKNDKGEIMTEYSIGVNINGKEMDIPTLVPTLTPEEITSLKAGNITDAITQKAVDHANKRIAEGKGVFQQDNENSGKTIRPHTEVAKVVPLTTSTASTNATEFIAKEEGFREKAYQDSAGVWTIGYGTTKINGKPIKAGDTISEAKAKTEIDREISRLETEIDKTFGNSINEYQKVALTSFMYNLGMDILEKPEAQILKTAIEKGDIDTIREQWVQYINAGGKPLVGLQNRRERELAQFLTSMA